MSPSEHRFGSFFQLLLILWLFASVASSRSIAPQADVGAALSRAETLYYEARFDEVIALLGPVDAALQSQSGLKDQKGKVKLQLALAHIGLNDTARAKVLFRELCDVDSDYSLDSKRFSPEVLNLFDEAKTEHKESTCRIVCDKANKRLDVGDIAYILEQIGSEDTICACLKAAALDAAELSYRQGVESYDNQEFTDALEKFRTALRLNPEFGFATQYLKLTENMLRLAAEGKFLEWRRHFDAREFALAFGAYREVLSFNADDVAESLVVQMQMEYRRILSQLLETWKEACLSGNFGALEGLRTQVAAVLPERTIAEDIIGQMTCDHKGCIQITGAAAMNRLISRVEPAIPANLRRIVGKSAPMTVYVLVRIANDGEVTVLETQGINAGIRDAVRGAVAKWKFSPVTIANETRCVDTILSVMINP